MEERLLQWSVRGDAEALSSLLASDFREFGSSGRVFDRQQVIEALRNETSCEMTLGDFCAQVLAPDIALVTYRASWHGTSGQPAAISLRSSLWVQREGRWQLVFHQGTRAAG